MSDQNLQVQTPSTVFDVIKQNGISTVFAVVLLWFAWTAHSDMQDRYDSLQAQMLEQQRTYVPTLTRVEKSLEANTEILTQLKIFMERQRTND